MYDDEADRGDKIRTCGLCVPNAALYQTEPRLDISYTIIRILGFVNYYFSNFQPYVTPAQNRYLPCTLKQVSPQSFTQNQTGKADCSPADLPRSPDQP